MDNQVYIQSQYSKSLTIKSLLQAAAERISPDADIELFYDSIFNLMTAKGIGLDIWGRILGITRDIELDETTAKTDIFGFLGSELYPFNQGVFYTDDMLDRGKKILAHLDDTSYRRLLLFKAMANICTGDIGTLNTLTNMVYETDSVLVTNIVDEGTLSNGDKYNRSPMCISWVWRKNKVTALDKALFYKTAALCVAAGVQYEVKAISETPLFGFFGSGLESFNNGAFGTVTYMTEG